MALTFSGGSTHLVNVGSGASLDDLTSGTYMAWGFYSSAAQHRIYQKGVAALDSTFNIFGGSTSNATLDWERDRATTDSRVTALLANFTAYSTGKWLFMAAVFDLAGASGDCKLYMGDLFTALAEPSAYVAQQVGSGAASADAATSGIIGNKSNGSANFPGRIAMFHIVSGRRLSLGELTEQQFRPHPVSGTAGFWHLGWNGTANVPDWSGNGNTGSITSATVSDHVPLGAPFAGDEYDASFAAAAAGLVWNPLRGPMYPAGSFA